MANSLQIGINVVYSNGTLQIPFQPQLPALTPAAFIHHGAVWSVPTSEATMAQGNVTDPHYLCLYNDDEANFVEIGPDDSGMVPLLHLEPGDIAVVPLKASTVVKAIADTAPVKLYVLLTSR